jgi:hypothetical protein
LVQILDNIILLKTNVEIMNKLNLFKTVLLLFIVVLYSCGNGNSGKGSANDSASAEKPVDSTEINQKASEEELKADSLASLNSKGYEVKMLEHGYKKFKQYSKTTLEYETLWDIINQFAEKSKKEMWEPEKFGEKINPIKNIAKGGVLTLRISRINIDAGNTELFTVIVKDTSDNELYRQALDSDVPEVPGSDDLWWNIATIPLPKKIQTPFYVYVIDKFADNPFKFIISEKK